MNRPLEGVRVLDFSRLLPGPYLTLVLADLGADVIKVEGPDGGDYVRHLPPLVGDMSARFQVLNRGKRSIRLDLKQPAARDAVLRMTAATDVIVESFRPGVMDRLGLSYASLCERRSDIILCSISGYGQTGPYRQRVGHDLNYVGTAGVLAMSGEAAGPPAVPGVQIADLAGGALWGLSGVLAALLGRDRGHGGAHLDIAMTEGAMALLAADLSSLGAGGAPPSRGTETLNGGLACYRVYRTKDDRYLSVAPLEPKFYLAFNEAIGRPAHFAELGLGTAEQERIAGEIQERLLQRTQAEWLEVFAGVEGCVDAVLEPGELDGHPQHQARGVFFDLPAPGGGSVRHVRLPIGEPRTEPPAPAHGEHTAEVLAELGFTAGEIAALT